MSAHRWILVAALAFAAGYVWLRGGFIGTAAGPPAARLPLAAGLARATFASGCFWSTETDFDKVRGVVSTTSGYTGGTTPHPDYEQVSRGATGHAEAVEVVFDPAVVGYEALLDHYWRNVDPFVAHRQFCDVGSQYRPAIFVHDASQRAAAEASKARMQQRFPSRAIVVSIHDAAPFFPAEEYHQDYARKNSVQYRFYRLGCGRDGRLAAIWAGT